MKAGARTDPRARRLVTPYRSRDEPVPKRPRPMQFVAMSVPRATGAVDGDRAAAASDDDIYAPAVQRELASRIARHARTQDPSDLWPGLTEAARVAAAREIERVAREVLAGAHAQTLDAARAHDAYALSIAGHTTGMGPLLARWMEDGRVAARDDVRTQFARQLAHARRRAARLERELLPVLDAMRARDVMPVALKGLHTAHAYFEEPGVRRMSDVDLLVDVEQRSSAELALRDAGFRVLGTSHWSHKQEWIGPGVEDRIFSVELSDERSSWVVELHTSLDRTFHAGAVAHLDALRAATVPFTLAGRQLRAQAPHALLLTLACHCSQELGSSRLLRLVEIIRVVRRETEQGRLDWSELLDALHHAGAARFTWPAFALAEQLAPGTLDARVLTLGRRQSTFAARHTVPRLTPAGGALDELGLLRQVMWMRGPVAVLHRVLRFAWPWRYGNPVDVVPAWRVRLRQLRAGRLSFRAPDERA
jgi:hypothetical protein